MVWTLRKKIFIGYGMALALMIVVLVWAFIHLLSLGHASDAILRENYKSILAAENMIDAIERQDSATLLVMLGYEDEVLKQYSENESHFLQWLGRAKDNITVKGEDKIINAIDTGYSSYLVNFSELRLFHQIGPQKAAAFYHEAVLPSFKLVRDACVRLREINQETMFKASDRARSVAGRAILSTVIIGIAAVGIGLGFSLLLSHLLTRPLRQVMEATHKIAEGNYDVEISTNSSDELGLLASEFNTMAKKLKTYRDLNIEQIVAEKRKSESIILSIDDGIVVVDAEEALAKLNEKEFGLILLDLKMPGIDGMEVLSRVRRIRPDIRIIIITAHGTVDSAVEAMKLGAVDFIQKPFAPKEIRELVSQVIDRENIDKQKLVNYESYIEVAKSYIGDRHFDTAIEYVRKAIYLDPSRPEALNLLGALLEIRGDLPEAQDYYRAALAHDPTYEPARQNLHRSTSWTPTGNIILGEEKKEE